MAATLVAALPPAAPAAVKPAVTIDGPSADVGPLGGVAFASDGTGGVVYTRAVDGRQHVFAARYDGHRWGTPQRLDPTVPFDSFTPSIGAASGGRLAVVWGQRVAAGVNALFSATLAQGATRFQSPTIIDYDFGDAQIAAPVIAMADSGAALVAYRAIRDVSGAGLPAGHVSGEIRLARYDRSRWSKLGVPANRNRATPLPAPSADTLPALAIDGNGNGAIAWVEADDGFIERVWMRRVFSSRSGVAQAVSATDARGAADRPSIAETGLGRVVISYRQLPDPRDRTAPPQTYVRELQDVAPKLGDPVLVGDAGDGAASIGTDRAGVTLGFSRGGTSLFGFAPKLPGAIAVREQDAALAAPAPVVAAGANARAVFASAGEAGGGEVAIRELDGTEVLERRPVSAGAGGPIRELAAAGTGRGDALVAFGQGADGDRQIAVSLVDAAPAPFQLMLPEGWSRARTPEVSWSPAPDALGQVIYTVSVDGRGIGRTRATAMRIREGILDQGSHTVRVVATDTSAQRTVADSETYKLDRQAPRAAITVRGRRVRVKITDPGGPKKASGVATGATSITWGDGASTDEATRNAGHSYKRRKSYTLSISASDAAGNKLVVKRTVKTR